jgi:hypothetical protein
LLAVIGVARSESDDCRNPSEFPKFALLLIRVFEEVEAENGGKARMVSYGGCLEFLEVVCRIVGPEHCSLLVS